MASVEQLGTKISVIIPVYNRVKLIQATLHSVINQSYQNWECIIVDDGSIDGSQDLIKDFTKRDSRARFFQRNREPKGAPTCRNIGLDKCEGEYIIFLDSDDLLAASCLENRLKVIQENPNYDFWVFPMQFFTYEIGDSDKIWLKKTYDDYLSGFLACVQWLITSPIWRKEALIRLGAFNENLISWQDWELHIRALAQKYNFIVIEETPDCYCRRDDADRISKGRNSLLQIENRINLLDGIYELLNQYNHLSALNKKLLTNKYLNVAISLKQLGLNNMVDYAWGRPLHLKLINYAVYRLGKLYIKSVFSRKIENKHINYANNKLWSFLLNGVI